MNIFIINILSCSVKGGRKGTYGPLVVIEAFGNVVVVVVQGLVIDATVNHVTVKCGIMNFWIIIFPETRLKLALLTHCICYYILYKFTNSGSKVFIPNGPSSFFSAVSNAAHALSSVNSSGAWNKVLVIWVVYMKLYVSSGAKSMTTLTETADGFRCHSFVHSTIYSTIPSFIPSTHPLYNPPISSAILQSIQPLIQPFYHPFIHSAVHSTTHTVIQQTKASCCSSSTN